MHNNQLHKKQRSRESLHREFAGEIRLSDFNTTYPNPRRRYTYTRLEMENRKKGEIKNGKA